MKLFCNHDYDLIKDHQIKSQMELMIDNGLFSMERGSSDLLKSKYYY